ncbi:hypothetical protein, partial [Klebsiella pneumoniae]|uniref:hypothetical protein n=1 Tax=Klebsiella pneumoniae TaxID=573 RepID=UPI001C5FE226
LLRHLGHYLWNTLLVVDNKRSASVFRHHWLTAMRRGPAGTVEHDPAGPAHRRVPAVRVETPCPCHHSMVCPQRAQTVAAP